jgi:hypothetical protein
MGMTTSREQMLRDLEASYQLLTDGFESRYGHVQIYKHKTEDKLMLVKEISCDDPRISADISNYLRSYNPNQVTNLCKIVRVSDQTSDPKKPGCTVQIEYYPRDLQNEIDANIKVGNRVDTHFNHRCQKRPKCGM